VENPASKRVLRVYSEKNPWADCPAASLTGMATGVYLDGVAEFLSKKYPRTDISKMLSAVNWAPLPY